MKIMFPEIDREKLSEVDTAQFFKTLIISKFIKYGFISY